MPKFEFDSRHSAPKLSNNVFKSFLWIFSLLLLFAQVSGVVCVIIALVFSIFWGQAYQTSDQFPIHREILLRFRLGKQWTKENLKKEGCGKKVMDEMIPNQYIL